MTSPVRPNSLIVTTVTRLRDRQVVEERRQRRAQSPRASTASLRRRRCRCRCACPSCRKSIATTSVPTSARMQLGGVRQRVSKVSGRASRSGRVTPWCGVYVCCAYGAICSTVDSADPGRARRATPAACDQIVSSCVRRRPCQCAPSHSGLAPRGRAPHAVGAIIGAGPVSERRHDRRAELHRLGRERVGVEPDRSVDPARAGCPSRDRRPRPPPWRRSAIGSAP